MVKMKPQDHFIGPCMAWVARRTLKGRRVCPVQLQGPQVSIDLVNVNQLTFEHKKKKKKRVSCPVLRTKLENFFKSAAATQPCQVKLASIHEKHNFHTQFWGNKMRNHILYLTPLITLKMSDKEGAVVNNVFCSSLICVPNLKIPKILSFLHGAMETSRLPWSN